MTQYTQKSNQRFQEKKKKKKTRKLAGVCILPFLQRTIRPQNFQPSAGPKAPANRARTGSENMSTAQMKHGWIPLNSFVTFFLLGLQSPESQFELSSSSDSLECNTRSQEHRKRKKTLIIKGSRSSFSHCKAVQIICIQYNHSNNLSKQLENTVLTFY